MTLSQFVRIVVIFSLLLFKANASIKKHDKNYSNFLARIETMIEVSPEYLTQKANLNLDRISKEQFYKILLPRLSVGVSAVDKGLGFGQEKKTRAYMHSQLNIFSGFSDSSSFNKIDNKLKSSQLELAILKSKLEEEYSLLLINHLSIIKGLEIQKKFLAIKKNAMLFSKGRFKKGMTSEQEYSKSLIDYHNTLAENETFKNKLELSIADILKIDPAFKQYNQWPFLKMMSLLKTKVKKMDLILEESMDFKLLKLNYQNTDFHITSSMSAFYPSLDLSFNLSKNLNKMPYEHEKESILTLSFPIFSRGVDQVKYRSAKFEQYSTKQKILKMRLDLNAKLIVHKKSLLRSLESLHHRKKTLVLSRKLYKNNFKNFKRGLISINDFQVDQNRLLGSEKLYNRGQYDFHQQVITFCTLLSTPLNKCF